MTLKRPFSPDQLSLEVSSKHHSYGRVWESLNDGLVKDTFRRPGDLGNRRVHEKMTPAPPGPTLWTQV